MMTFAVQSNQMLRKILIFHGTHPQVGIDSLEAEEDAGVGILKC